VIIIHEGVPGSGKSYDAIRKIIDALKNGRIVYTNIDGVHSDDCREVIAALTGFSRDALDDRLFFLEAAQIINFWDICPSGAFVVIDEAQLFFNSRDWSKDDNRRFADWASTHRHYGYDLLLITQRAERIDSAVRSLCEFRYRYRKLNMFGSMVKKGYLVYTYCGDDSRPLGKPSKRTYQAEIFRAYQSYQGDSTEKAVVKNPNILNHPLVWFAGLLVIGAVWSFSKSSFATGDPLGYGKLTENVYSDHAQTSNGGSRSAGPGSMSGDAPHEPIVTKPVSEASPEILCLPMTIYAKMDGREYIMVGRYRLKNWISYDLSNRIVWVLHRDMPPEVAELGQWAPVDRGEYSAPVVDEFKTDGDRSYIIQKPSYMTKY
jgi:zona occludens toxin (predicted ATPase)